MIKDGSKWGDGIDKVFIVLHSIEQNGHTWVHYRSEKVDTITGTPKEYSCYQESFLSRFRPLPE
jgi:hypothetical protein